MMDDGEMELLMKKVALRMDYAQKVRLQKWMEIRGEMAGILRDMNLENVIPRDYWEKAEPRDDEPRDDEPRSPQPREDTFPHNAPQSPPYFKTSSPDGSAG